MNIAKNLIFIARALVAEEKWTKVENSTSKKQGWKRKNSWDDYEYIYSDTDPNLDKETIKQKHEDFDMETFPYFQSLGNPEIEKDVSIQGNLQAEYSQGKMKLKPIEKGKLLFAKNELLADRLYSLGDVNTQQGNICQVGNKLYVGHHKLPERDINLSDKKGAVEGFVLDCFLGNTGIEQSKGKVIDKASSYGSLYRLNNSGTMMFNLDGSVNEKFGNTVPELDDFRSSEKTPTTSFIYNDIEEEPLLNQIRGIKENFTDSIIKEYVNSCFKDNPEIEKKLVETLIARKNYIVNYGSQIAKKGLDKLRPKRTEKFNIPPVQEPGDITPDEKSAIKEYTGSDYASINRYLRGTGYQDEEGHQKYLPVVKQMVSGLKKYPVYHGKVFRGCDIDENTLSIVTSLKSNDVFYMKAFSSTSKNQYKSFSGKIKFTILSKTGRNIEGNSYSPLEEEILFAPDTRFKVTEINIKSGYDYQISLEEILPDEMRDVAPVNSDKKAPLTPEKIREFLLKNPKLTPAQREKIMTLSEEDLKKVMIAIFSKTKGKGSKNGEEISDKFTEVFV